MDLKRLKHVIALAQRGSFAQAAEMVHLSQPAFSRSIQSLEEELQVELFTRGQRRITLTPYGKLVVERGQRMLAEAKSLQRDVKRMRAHEFGEIALGFGPIPAAALLEPMLTRVTRDHPSIRTHIEITHWRHLLKLLEMDDLDFFIADVRELLSSERLAIDLMPEFRITLLQRSHPARRPSPSGTYWRIPSARLSSQMSRWPVHQSQFEGDPRTLFSVSVTICKCFRASRAQFRSAGRRPAPGIPRGC